MPSFQTELFSSFLPSTYAGNANLAAAKPWQFIPNWKHGITLEFIIVRVFVSAKYRVIYYNYIVKWCSFINCNGKGSFYIAQYPVRWTAQSASHFLPSLTDLFIPTPFSASPGSILARQQLRAKTKSFTFPPLSIARYSFIQLSEQRRL